MRIARRARPANRGYAALLGDGDPAKALERAHDLRRFEIENYWRRSTYFWGFQLAALAALAIARQSGAVSGEALMIVAILGMVTAHTGVLTARGSKFWQRNWETHVDYLEDGIEGRLHKTVFYREDGLQPSVSRANERLLQLLTIGWICAFAIGAFLCANFDPSAAIDWHKTSAIGALTAAAAAAMTHVARTPRSKVEDRAFDWKTLAPYPVTGRSG